MNTENLLIKKAYCFRLWESKKETLRLIGILMFRTTHVNCNNWVGKCYILRSR